jgi:glycosyltransferase involved in cell wall biosynthesis
MKVLLISKDARTGGAAVAARSLMESLREVPLDVEMLVQEGGDGIPGVISTTSGMLKKGLNRARFILERLTYLPHEKDQSLRFMFSPANVGEDITKIRQVREADLIHLHWINGGFLSLGSLKRLMELEKPLVWTFHDIWAATGGCHMTLDCTGYQRKCGHCPYVINPRENDISSRLWKKKSALFGTKPFTIITPSRWMKSCVESSTLLGHCEVHAIPNPIDTGTCFPVDREEACRRLGLDPGKLYILFTAANVRNMIKGFGYLTEAVRILYERLKGDDRVELLLLGRSKGDEAGLFPFRTTCMPYTRSQERINDLYNAARLFVNSSLVENFPNTIIESMLCGTPAVAFSTGGIPEMIRHREDGYLADHRSAEDLAEGMEWLLSHPDYQTVSAQARKSALDRFSREKSVQAHLDLYRKLLNT